MVTLSIGKIKSLIVTPIWTTHLKPGKWYGQVGETKKEIFHERAKNYLTPEELESLGKIVSAYLDLAEDRTKRKIPMTMEDWAKRLDQFLKFDEREILDNAGTISNTIAKDFAESEFEKYRIIQDRLFESDFDKEAKKLEQHLKKKNENKNE